MDNLKKIITILLISFASNLFAQELNVNLISFGVKKATKLKSKKMLICNFQSEGKASEGFNDFVTNHLKKVWSFSEFEIIDKEKAMNVNDLENNVFLTFDPVVATLFDPKSMSGTSVGEKYIVYDYKENFKNPKYETVFFGWLCSNIAEYGDTSSIPCDVMTKNGNYRPEKIFSGISLVEEFNPLIKVDVRMKNSFSIRAELKQDKALNLNVSNNTITEIRGKEYVLGLGYRLKDVKLKIRTGNTLTSFKGDINFTGDVSIRNNSTTIRSIDVLNNQVTGGQRLLSFKFQADYQLNKNLFASFYYDQNSSRFLISTTFPRQSINSGFNIIYNLGGN